jgi:hypothetical protein
VVGHVTQIKAKLVLNPDLYPLTSLLSGPIPLQGAVLTEENGAIVLNAMARPGQVPVRGLLETLKYIYRHLETARPGPGAGYQLAGMEV